MKRVIVERARGGGYLIVKRKGYDVLVGTRVLANGKVEAIAQIGRQLSKREEEAVIAFCALEEL